MIKTEAYNDCQQFLALTKKNGVKAGKLYVKKPLNVASAFNVSRNLAAYRTNQDGLLELMGANVPRIDYANGCPELLVENEAENIILQSETYDNASWIKVNSTVSANVVNAPNNELKADKLIENAGSGQKYILQQYITSSTYRYAFSTFIKADGRNFIRYGMTDGISDAYVDVNLTNGATANLTAGGSWTNPSAIVTLINGFYRVTFICTKGAGTSVFPIIYLCNTLGNTSYTGDGVSGVYLWGSQLEVTFSDRPTSYIPTTTVAVTRPADVIDNSTFGYDNDTSTIFIRARLEFSESVQGLVTLSDGGVLDDYMSLWIVESGGDKFLAIDTYTNPDQNTIYVTLPSDGVYSIALGYNLLTAEYSLAVNGVIESSGTFVNALPTSAPLTTMQLGRINTNYDARVIGFMYFDSKLDNTSLENLTTI